MALSGSLWICSQSPCLARSVTPALYPGLHWTLDSESDQGDVHLCGTKFNDCSEHFHLVDCGHCGHWARETGWVGRGGMFGSVIGTSTDDYSLSHSLDDNGDDEDDEDEGESGGRNVCICNWSLNS